MVNKIVSRGVSWNVLDSGAGDRTLVFLPGTLGSVEIFRKQIEAFSANSRVVVLGYPGSADFDQLSDSFWNLLKDLKVDAPYLIGSSLGAFLLQHFTSESAYGAQGLVLGNTFADSHRLRFLRPFDPAFIEQATPAQAKQVWLNFVESLKSEELKAALLPMVRDQQSDEELHGRSLTISRWGPVRPSAMAPERVVVLSCADDPVCGEAVTAEIAAKYPQSRHVQLATGAHYPHVINAQAYNEAIKTALSLA